MQSETIQVQFTLTPKDLRSFRWFHLRKSWFGLGLIVAAVFLVFLFNLFEGQAFDLLLRAGVSADMASVVVGWTPFFVIAVLLIGLIAFRQRRESSLRSRRPVYMPQRFTISPQGLHIERDGLVGDVAWKVVSQIRVRNGATYIFLDDMQGYIIPVRAFESTEKFEAFNNLVQHFFTTSHPAAG